MKNSNIDKNTVTQQPSTTTTPSPQYQAGYQSATAVSIKPVRPSAAVGFFSSFFRAAYGFILGAFVGVYDLATVPVRYLSVAVILGLFYALNLAFSPLRIMRRVPLAGLVARFALWLVEFLLLSFLYRLTSPLRRFFYAGWKNGGAVPMLLGLLPFVLVSAWQYRTSNAWVRKELVLHKLTLNHVFYFYAALLGLWVLYKALLYSYRQLHLVAISGHSSLRRGESWTDTSRLDSQQKAELNDRFERAAAAGFAAMGYSVIVNGTQLAKTTIGHTGGGDGGVDVFACNKKESIVISCKRYADPVGVPEVREIYGTSGDANFTAKAVAGIVRTSSPKSQGPSKAVLVTTIGVTADAAAFARRNGIRVFVINDQNQMLRAI